MSMRLLKDETLTLARFAEEDGSLGRFSREFGEDGYRRRTICSNHLLRGFFLMRKLAWKERRAYFDIWVALHDLLYPCQWEGRMAVIRGILLGGVDLSPPERRKEF